MSNAESISAKLRRLVDECVENHDYAGSKLDLLRLQARAGREDA